MKRKSIFIILLLIAAMAITLVPYDTYAQRLAPEFTLSDLKGKTFRLKDYQAKTVLLIFGATWCPSCRAEIPHFKDIFAKYNPRGLVVAYINIDEPQDRVTRFSAKYQLPYRTLLDAKGNVANDYDVMGVPAMVLIKEGKILTRNYRLMESHLEKLFPPSSR